MDKSQALQILIQTAQISVKRGGFELKDAKIIAEAVEVFTNKDEPEPEAKKKK